MKKNITLDKSFLYYAGFILAVVLHLGMASALVDLSDGFYQVFIFIISALFFGKILLDGHTRKELLVIFFATILVVLLYILGAPAFLVIFYLAFVAIKEVDIRRIIKLDMTIKIIFLLVHAALFYLDYLTGESGVLAFINESTKGGVENSLYFINPNNTGMIGVWIALDWLLLIKNKTIKSYILPTLFVLAIFSLTLSRTAIGVYFVYLLLQFIKSNRTLTVASKIIYPLCAILSILIVTNLTVGSNIVVRADNFLSGRIWFSITAYNLMGMHFMPFSQGAVFMETYIIDNFYVKCLVYYGVSLLLIYLIPYILLPKKAKAEAKRISIVSGICMLFENTTANIGLALPYLIMADAFYNGEENEKKKSKK